MASWGDVEVYNQMITDLNSFIKALEEACVIMLTAAQTCMDNMESDSASLAAYKNVSASVKKYQEAQKLAKNLITNLTDERDEIIAYLRKLEELENGGEG